MRRGCPAGDAGSAGSRRAGSHLPSHLISHLSSPLISYLISPRISSLLSSLSFLLLSSLSSHLSSYLPSPLVSHPSSLNSRRHFNSINPAGCKILTELRWSEDFSPTYAHSGQSSNKRVGVLCELRHNLSWRPGERAQGYWGVTAELGAKHAAGFVSWWYPSAARPKPGAGPLKQNTPC